MQFMRKLGLPVLLSSALVLTACGGGGGGSNGSGGGSGGGLTNPLQPPPSGRTFYTYAVNDAAGGQDTVSIFRADSAIGELNLVGAVNAGTNPAAVIVVANRFVYVANAGAFATATTPADNGNISAYAITPTTGELTPIAGSPYTAGVNPSALATTPDNRFLYVANSNSTSVSAYSIGASGALTLIGTASTNFPSTATNGTSPAGLAVSPNGRFLFCANKNASNAAGNGTVTAFDIASDGSLTTRQNVVAGVDPIAIAIDPTGTSVYVANNLLPDDAATPTVENRQGTVTMFPVSSSGTLGAATSYISDVLPQSVAVDANNNVYVANSGANNISVFTRAADGTLTLNTRLAGGPTPWGVNIGPLGSFLYIANAAVGGDGGVGGYALQAGAAPRAIARVTGAAPVRAVASTGVLP